MGLISKIANSKWAKGAGAVFGAGAAIVPTYEMLNPPAVYAQTNYLKGLIGRYKQGSKKIVEAIQEVLGQVIYSSDPNELTRDEYVIGRLVEEKDIGALLNYYDLKRMEVGVQRLQKEKDDLEDYGRMILKAHIKGIRRQEFGKYDKSFDKLDRNKDGKISPLDEKVKSPN